MRPIRAVILVSILALPALAEPVTAPPAHHHYFKEGRMNLEVPAEVWDRALSEVGFAGRPLGYTADEMANYGPAQYVLPAVSGLFRDIRLVPRFTGRAGDGFLARMGEPKAAVWYAFRMLGVSAARGIEPPDTGKWGVAWIPDGTSADAALDAFLARVPEGEPFGLLAGEDRERFAAMPEPLKVLAVRALVGLAEAAPALRNAFDEEELVEALGPEARTPGARYALAVSPFFDETPSKRSLEMLEEVDLAWLALGSVTLLSHVQAGIRDFVEAGDVDLSGVKPVRFDTPAGPLAILSPGNDEAPTGCTLVIDTGGDDLYRGPQAVPVSSDHPAGVVIDLAGDDRYEAKEGKAALACGCFGVGALFDLKGNDRYSAEESGLGCGWYGTGLLVDEAGDDVYEGGKWVQGAAHAGVGLLIDRAGRDRYLLKSEGQGFGGTLGIGALVDGSGDDEYVADLAGNIEEIFRGQSVSFAQGAGYGRRADFGDGHSLAGGIGLLVEAKGDDSYTGGVYCQGAGYWWSIGAIEDRAGNDRYSSVQYSLGSAPHMAIGSCVDLAGNDSYNMDTKDLYMQSVGCARDASLAVFIDGAGDDLYRVGNRSAGSGEVNAIGWFWDRCGDDTYVSERATPSPGSPAFGGVGVETADAGSFRAVVPAAGVFLDTGGTDTWADRRPEDFQGAAVRAADNSAWRHTEVALQRSIGLDVAHFRLPPPPDFANDAITIRRVETSCNTYFVCCRKTWRFVVVDPGPGVLPEVHARTEGGWELEAVWITHEHGDHLLGLAELIAEYPVPIFAHPETVLSIAREREHWKEWWGAEGAPPPPMPDRLVEDGQEVSVGEAKAVAIHVPGHSRGSILFRFGDAVVLSGDVLFRGSVGRTDLDSSDQQLFMKGLADKVFDLPDEMVVLPGHERQTRMGAEKESNWFLVDYVRAARGESPIPRPWMGVKLDEEYEGQGLRVAEVPPDTPAEKSGLIAGDVMLRLGEFGLGGYGDLSAAIRTMKVGDHATLVVLRDGKEVVLDFVFGARPR